MMTFLLVASAYHLKNQMYVTFCCLHAR